MIIIEHEARVIPAREFFDQHLGEFISFPEIHLKPMNIQLEHSLISVRNWEMKHHQPFADIEEMTPEQLIGYIKCMTINRQKDESVYDQLSAEDLTRIIEYIKDPASAWQIPPPKNQKGRRKRANTVESIYYAMIQCGIPLDCEKWHLNSLMALIDYCTRQGKVGGGKPKSQKELTDMYFRINEANRKKYHSRG